MPGTADTYSAAQAAQILGVTERRVRQLVAQGTLTGDRAADGTVRIPQQAVTEERKRRRKSAAPARSGRTQPNRSTSRRRAEQDGVDVTTLADAVATAVGQRLEGQLELTRRAESLIRQELDEERARRIHVEAQLRTAESRLADLQQANARRRGLFRRGAPA